MILQRVPDATKMERFACTLSTSKTEHVPSQWGRRRSEDNWRVGDIRVQREGQPTVLTLALTTPLPPTSGARFLPRSGVNRQDLCCPPRSNGVSVAEFGRWCRPASIAQSSKVVGVVEGLVVGQCDAERGNGGNGRVDERDPGGANPENVVDEDGDMLLSGRAEHQSGSKRTGVSVSLSLLSLALFFPLTPAAYYSILVPFVHFSHFHAPRGEAEEQSLMAGREPAYYAVKRYHDAQSSAIKPPGSVNLPEQSLF